MTVSALNQRNLNETETMVEVKIGLQEPPSPLAHVHDQQQ